MKTIKFRNKNYKLKKFNYSSGDKGLMLINIDNENDFFSITLNIPTVRTNIDDVIIKSHDSNKGILNILINEKIIKKQFKPVPLGYNSVYVCNLINGSF